MNFKRNMAVIDLNRMRVAVQPIPDDWRQKYIGGRGLGSYLLMKHAPPACDPLGPDNVLVIGAGPAAGTPLAPVAATYLTTKSALSGGLVCAVLDPLTASGLRWAGFDEVVIKGRSEDPVWLDVCKGKIQFRDARQLWGAGIRETRAELRRLGQDDFQGLVIGPAAENRLRFAGVTTASGTCAGRTGVGAVLGAKKIKAVTLRGSLDIAVKHPVSLLEESRALLASIVGGTGRSSAPARTQAAVFSLSDLPLVRFGGRRIPAKSGAEEYALDLGLDPTAAEALIAWVDRLFKAGMLPRHAVNAKLGPAEDIRGWLRCIAYREGIGDVLAEGPDRAASIMGHAGLRFFEPLAPLLKLYTEDMPDPMDFLQPAELHPTGTEAEKTPRPGTEMPDAADYAGVFGRIGRRELNRMIWDCAGVYAGANSGRGGLDGLAVLLGCLTGWLFTVQDLETIAYRAVAIERLFDRAQKTDKEAPRLPTDGLACLRLSESEWRRLDLDQYRRRLAACGAEKSWNSQLLEESENWRRLGIGDLRPPG